MDNTEKLYRINDALTSLASELQVEWSGDMQQDTTIDSLTHMIAVGFGIEN